MPDLTAEKLTVYLGAAANTGGLAFPLVCAGSNYVTIHGVSIVDVAGNSGATGSAYLDATATKRGTAGTGTTTVATRKNNAAAADYMGAYVPWALTMSTTKTSTILSPGEALTITIGGSGANGTLTRAAAVVHYSIGYAGA